MANAIIQTSAFTPVTKQVQFKKSLVATKGCPAPARVTVGAIRCQTSSEQNTTNAVEVSRRGLVSLASAAPIFYAAKAFALIDYDEDDALLSKIRADRQAKLQSELINERASTRNEGFKSRVFDKEVSSVQKAVNQLSQSGKFLESGNMGDYKATVTDMSWVDELKSVSKEISLSSESQKASSQMFSAISEMQKNAGNSSAATKSYLNTLEKFEDWCTVSGVASSVTGL
mmetsp:Transcript_33636/g.40642  ORF Transcript_33636/g.40642 Transcript_33636/m.40642 type:complete len:229 (-) Transcript_33636:92-778(-)|eukprot:CAMPEP_0197850642 /NCGR_PEP_ID=MMETSP1438-20131217/15964_1 /TAXON_ID=1461541 /ORGANISM="Pterosperma sp., Strain CCMP1384" /LENGTH=228 /DNA_ID=CAMNT_0043463915 /DNA_START=48 /DNA_END=734 /DNA_ORIENTATION=-